MVREEAGGCPGCGRLAPAQARCCPTCGAVQLAIPAPGTVLRGRWQLNARRFSDAWGRACHEAEDVRVFGRTVLIRQWAQPFDDVAAALRWRLLEARAALDVPSLPAWYDLYEEADAWWVVEAKVPWPALPFGWTAPSSGLARVASGLVEAMEALHACGLDAGAPGLEDLRLDPDGEAILLARGNWRRWSWHPLGQGPEVEDAGQLARADLASVAALLRAVVEGDLDPNLEGLLREMEAAPFPGGPAGACFLEGRHLLAGAARAPGPVSLAPEVLPTAGEPTAAWRLAPALDLQWRQPLGAVVEAVVPLGPAHLGTWDREGVLTLRRWSDGAEVWSRPVPVPGDAPSGGVSFASRWVMPAQDTLVAMGLQTAEPEWIVDIRGLRARDPLAVGCGLLMVADPVERVFRAFDGSGREVWQAGFGKARSHLDVEALDRLDGRVRWSVHEDRLGYAFKGRMGVLDVRTGLCLWEQDLPAGPEGASRQARVCLGVDVLVLADRGGRAWIRDARTGAPIREQPALPGDDEVVPPAIVEGLLVLAASPWKWTASELGTGERQWVLHVGGTSLSVQPAASGLLVQGAAGPLLRVEGRSGRVLAQADPGCAMTGGPWLMEDGGILTILDASVLAAFR
ncbi:MAG: PQQ-binding-like beta-propeller repeat protein [Candidatus Sericytochromatia bacterium]|nr:PQQ-binding-like beta-propeller repeat protein [Candidatus Tanganyikabacteria bacterium]